MYKEKKRKQYQYSLNDIIGKGAFSIVYKALDTSNNQYVALKLIDSLNFQSINQDTFKREVQMGEKYKHLIDQSQGKNNDADYIIYQIEHFEDDGCQIIIQEYLKNCITLEQFLNNKEYIVCSELDVLRIAFKILKGLRFFQINGDCHRDLKPANIVINTKTGSLKIIDFGASREVQGNQDGDLRLQSYIGTPLFMPPEQLIQQKQGYDGYKGDIYSFGVILFLMLTSKYPFECEDKQKLQEQMQNKTSNNIILMINQIQGISDYSKNILKACITFEDQRIQLSKLFEFIPFKNWDNNTIFYFDPLEQAFDQMTDQLSQNNIIFNLVLVTNDFSFKSLKIPKIEKLNSHDQKQFYLITLIYDFLILCMERLPACDQFLQSKQAEWEKFADKNVQKLLKNSIEAIYLLLRLYQLMIDSIKNIYHIHMDYYDVNQYTKHLNLFKEFYEYQLLEMANMESYKQYIKKLEQFQLASEERIYDILQMYENILNFEYKKQLTYQDYISEKKIIDSLFKLIYNIIKQFKLIPNIKNFVREIEKNQISYEFIEYFILNFYYLKDLDIGIQQSNFDFQFISGFVNNQQSRKQCIIQILEEWK